MKQLLKFPILLLFGGFILLFSAWDTTQTNRTFSEFENRYLQQQPKFSWKKLMDNSYTKDYETYINDQFIHRDNWIALKSLAETGLGKIENNGIVSGADGYLFEKYKTVPTEQLEKNIGFIRRFLEQYPDLPVTFSVIPNAYTILADKVPYGLNNIDQRLAIADITGRVSAGTSVKVLNLEPSLSAHREEEIYYRTDHHWTTRGAYWAYSAYVESLGGAPVDFSELTPLGVEVPDFYGTYYSKQKKVGTQPDTIVYYDIPVEETLVDGNTVSGYYDLEKFTERDKYAAFLRGNNGYTVLKSAVNRGEAGVTSKVLVIKDSYGNSLVPFLLYNFDEVHIVDLRAGQKPLSEILAENTFTDVFLLYNFMNLASDTNLYRLSY